MFIFSDNGAEATSIDNVWLAGEDADKYAEWMNQFDNSVESIGTERSNTALGFGWSQVGSTPLFREKGMVSEGGILAPMLVVVPGTANFKSNTFAHVTDITPTVLDYAGVMHPGDSYDGRDVHPMDGRSLKPLFEGETDRIYAEDESFVVELFGNKAVFKGDWKALEILPPFGEGGWKLFNLVEDIRELNDLSSENPELLEELKKDYEVYANRVGVIIPEGIDVPR